MVGMVEEKISEIKVMLKKIMFLLWWMMGLIFNIINKTKKSKNILEIGTAIGYSAIMMALVDENIKITSIEKDNKRYFEAIKC